MQALTLTSLPCDLIVGKIFNPSNTSLKSLLICKLFYQILNDYPFEVFFENHKKSFWIVKKINQIQEEGVSSNREKLSRLYQITISCRIDIRNWESIAHASSEISMVYSVRRAYELEKALYAVNLINFFTKVADYLKKADLPEAHLLLEEIAGQSTSYQGEKIADWLQSHSQALRAISSLNLSSTCLRILPKEIELFANLEVLNLNDNCLTHLPKQIGKLPCLRQLELKNNDLISLPEELTQLLALQSINIQKNDKLVLSQTLNLFLSRKQLHNQNRNRGIQARQLFF